MSIVKFTGGDAVMSSQEIADLVGSRHDNVKRAVERIAAKGVIKLPPLEEVKNHLGQMVEQYLFAGVTGKRDSFVVVAQLSPEFTGALVDRWQELEGGARQMTQAEMIAASANILVSLERQQAQQQIDLVRVERKVEVLADLRTWDHCPQNCVSLTKAKEMGWDRYGLSGAVADFVLRTWHNQPNHAGMVRNGHEEAQGSQYIVWAKSHVTAAFKRFASECQMVSETQATHPDYARRFRLVEKVKS
ncbi:hypothetical protein AABC73_06900 [Pseudomonas sp. G.S.17]|uniref:hypothetical protein n=1 Tax=Pseudomonas sp. G.S.17 TaxID=3137451 RepID=UPI00311CA893